MKQSPTASFIALLCAAGVLASCSVIQEVGRGFTTLSRCTFKLHGVSDFRLAGVQLSGRANLSPVEAARVAASFAQGALPASFTLNVAARNPNDSTEGTTRTTATMTHFAWTLLLDGTPTIAGDIAGPIEIPGTGRETIIPLKMSVDLVAFFREKGYDRLLNLALALGGVHGSASRVTLRARPTISTPLGPLTYPGEIEIVEKEFRGD
jgi:hypothetical protein